MAGGYQWTSVDCSHFGVSMVVVLSLLSLLPDFSASSELSGIVVVPVTVPFSMDSSGTGFEGARWHQPSEMAFFFRCFALLCQNIIDIDCLSHAPCSSQVLETRARRARVGAVFGAARRHMQNLWIYATLATSTYSKGGCHRRLSSPFLPHLTVLNRGKGASSQEPGKAMIMKIQNRSSKLCNGRSGFTSQIASRCRPKCHMVSWLSNLFQSFPPPFLLEVSLKCFKKSCDLSVRLWNMPAEALTEMQTSMLEQPVTKRSGSVEVNSLVHILKDLVVCGT